MRFFPGKALCYNSVQNCNLGVEELMRKWFRLIVIIFCLFLTGCSLDIKSLFVKEETPILSNLTAEALYFEGQKAKEKTKELINSAQESIYIEQKIFADGELKDLIIKKAASGVQIKILLDQFQTANKSTLNEFKSHNISVQYYPAQKGQTNEVKILVVDLKEALVYSFPWTEEGFASHNLAVHLTGRSAWKLASRFNQDWLYTTTLSLDIPKTTDLEEDNITVAVDANVKNQLLNQIKKSTNAIWLTASHITDQEVIQALIESANKGVDVKILLDSEIMPANYPGTLEEFLNAGIQIRYYDSQKQPPLAINLGLFDNSTFFFSSSGWGYRAFVMNHELSITVPSPEASAELIARFDRDWLSSSAELPKQE